MNYQFDEIINRSGTGAIKFDSAHKRNPQLSQEFIPMWIADMDFACPQPILDAMHHRLDNRILGYTDLYPAFNNAVADWMSRRFGWEADTRDMLHFPGVVTALHTLVPAMTQPGDRVLLQPPVYPPFLESIQGAGRHAVYNMLLNDNGHYTVDWDDFEDKLRDPALTLFILCSPHNPTGRVWREEELRRMADLCFANGVRIISDEIHCDITRTGVQHLPLAKLYVSDKRIVTCTAPSKTFNLAGNQQSNIFIPDEALRSALPPHAGGHPNPLSLAATQAAYTHCDGWLEELRSYIDVNLKTLADVLAARLPGAVYHIPQGTYLAWVNLACTGLGQQELMTVLSRDAGLMLEDGTRYVAGGEGFVRINCACPNAVVVQAANRLCDTLAPYCK